MSARLCKSLGLLLILSLLLAACQPIQPFQPTAAEAETAAPAAEAAVPALVERTFPTAGITVSLPEAWVFAYEPTYEEELMLGSAMPPPEPQFSGGFWEYLMEEPIVTMDLVNRPLLRSTPADLAQLLSIRYTPGSTGENTINPAGPTTIVEGPTLLTINGQPAARMVVEGTDVVLQKPFRAYVYAIQNGNRVVYISSALLEQNEAAFLPLVDQIAQSVVVNEPQTIETPLPVATGEIAPGMTVTGTLRPSLPDQVLYDYWHFAGEAGKRYIATALADDPYSDILFDIVDAAGTSQIGYVVDEAGSGGAEKAGFNAKADGDYFIAVRNFFLDPGGYTLTLEVLE